MANESGYYRHPAIHGERIVFVCEGDLWEVPVAGGVPRRLTASPGAITFPVFSPDGRTIAFTGRDDGPAEAYVVASQGGAPTRITWLGSITTTVAWTPDSSSVVVASDAGQPFRGYSHLHAVAASGTVAPAPMRVGPARAIAWEPAGRGVVIGRNSGDPARWKRYRGGTAGTIWIDRDGDGGFATLVNLAANLATPMWLAGRIYFLSDHEGHGNLYSCAADGSELRRHTRHEDFYVRFPSTDGRRIAYHAGADLFVFDPATDATTAVPVRWSSPRAQRNRKFVPAAKHLESFDVHPQGHSIACVVRGGVHTAGLWDGAPQRLGAASGVRHRLARWLADGIRLVAVTDEGGTESLVVLGPGGSATRVESDDVGRALDLLAAPAGGDRVAIANHRQEVIVVDLTTGRTTIVAKSAFDRSAGLAWSADGRFLACSIATSQRTSAIHVWDSATGALTRVTRPEFRDEQPAFDPEGRYLYFISWRVFDPVYDSHYFDLGFPRGSIPCLIPLRAALPSPFAAALRAPRAPGPPQSPPPGAAKESDPPVAIEFDGIEDRVLAFPMPEGRYLAVRAVPGRAVFLSWPHEGSLGADPRPGAEPAAKGQVDAWDFEADKLVPVMQGVTSFEVARDGKALALRAGSRVRVIAPPGPGAGKEPAPKDEPGRESGWFDLDRFRVAVVPGQEWLQMFREAWRLQRDHFWTPDMSSIDWAAVLGRYEPLLDRVATRSEFSDLVWEMQGELGTSHAYEMGGDHRGEPSWFQGFLGADVAFDAVAGAWRITRVPRGDSWVAASVSPLAAPGVDVRTGDAILAVDGEPLSAGTSPAARLVDQAGRDIGLTVRRGDGAPRTVAIRTLRDEFPLRYRDWVEGNRARVHQISGGRAGYVHIPDMGPRGYSEFHRCYAAEVERDALVVDVRWNGGGHVSQLILEKLARVRRGWAASRWMQPSSYPADAPMGPMVALTNEYAGSDGDMFSHCFKLYELGPLIGKRTWGGVVGIWPRHSLVDGTVTTQPEFAHWFDDVHWGLENYGTDPDIEVEIRPQDHAAGLDPQLDRGIAEVLLILGAAPPRVPDLTAGRPVRRPPPLK